MVMVWFDEATSTELSNPTFFATNTLETP